jgi:hypothetical protein
MKVKSRKSELAEPDDDVWVIIGLIFGAVTLALYAPLIWQATHTTL